MISLNGLNALIVEDDPDILELIAEDFSDAGAEVQMAGCGFDAVQLVKKMKFDFVLSDMRMQNGDGNYVAAELQKIKGPKPLLFIYSGFNDLTKESLAGLGIREMFYKPIATKVMIEKIFLHLSRK